ncbi:MAG: hypothetical protein RBT33_00955 [Candidatus Dojkabacteria bacterium]|jgi:hypothetical protein|nr:hypothetical protein [Candidatus Dojkabacteria bacterium]MDX9738922.1 hypothetical protein [Candidatus Dojkabacteria bacterium]
MLRKFVEAQQKAEKDLEVHAQKLARHAIDDNKAFLSIHLGCEEVTAAVHTDGLYRYIINLHTGAVSTYRAPFEASVKDTWELSQTEFIRRRLELVFTNELVKEELHES